MARGLEGVLVFLRPGHLHPAMRVKQLEEPHFKAYQANTLRNHQLPSLSG